MEATNYVFQRYEKKYILNQLQLEQVKHILENKFVVDRYGVHTICNIYYDTDQYDIIRRSIEKPIYKEKFRLRSYGIPSENDNIFLEIKKKYKGIVYKRRENMNLYYAMQYLEKQEKPLEMSQILKEIDYFLYYYQPKPKVYIAYDRIAFGGLQENNLRITFDQNIRYRFHDLHLQNGDYGEQLLPEGYCLMEIKIHNAFPLWLTRALNELSIFPSSFSKYGTIYKNEQMKRVIGGELC